MTWDRHVHISILFACLFFKRISLEKAMAPHYSTLAWQIPWMEEPGRLQSMGSPRVGHDWVTSVSLFTFMHWRRIWQPTPVFLPGESHGWRSLVGYSPRGCKESDMTEWLQFQFQWSFVVLTGVVVYFQIGSDFKRKEIHENLKEFHIKYRQLKN